jgi:ATP-binding cassette subfamily B protein
VSIDGFNVRDLSLHELRANIAVVPQESFLFSTSILENIRFGCPDATEEEVRAAAAAASLLPEINQLPDGFDTVVGERGITLSGGQKQRIALARAIVASPSILILDDAFSAIDTNTEDHIRRALAPIMAQRTTILVAHRLSTVQHCSIIVVLERGRIIEQGTHTELVQQNGVYAAMYARQQLEHEIAS